MRPLLFRLIAAAVLLAALPALAGAAVFHQPTEKKACCDHAAPDGEGQNQEPTRPEADACPICHGLSLTLAEGPELAVALNESISSRRLIENLRLPLLSSRIDYPPEHA